MRAHAAKPRGTQRCRRPWGALLAACLLICLGLAAAAATEPKFPERIGQLTLSKVVTRKAAQDSLNAIHERPIEVARAAIAYYQGPGASVVVWWSRASSPEAAQAQLERMVAKIGRGSYPYSQHRQLKRGASVVHAFQGHGQTHYTWRRADEVFWIAAPARLIDSVFEAVMK